MDGWVVGRGVLRNWKYPERRRRRCGNSRNIKRNRTNLVPHISAYFRVFPDNGEIKIRRAEFGVRDTDRGRELHEFPPMGRRSSQPRLKALGAGRDDPAFRARRVVPLRYRLGTRLVLLVPDIFFSPRKSGAKKIARRIVALFCAHTTRWGVPLGAALCRIKNEVRGEGRRVRRSR